MKRIDAYWYSQNPVAWLLLPLAAFFCLLVLIRRTLYRTGVFKSHKLPVPVVVVGNISVGGTGKTPLLIALVELLTEQGYRPGVISRGYGGSLQGCKLVEAGDSPVLVGDEPRLIHMRTGCPVAVGRDRVAVANQLMAHAECDIILSDDGLQHYRLQRDIEIVVIDHSRRFGNGFCLPAGPLREPTTRLKQADLIVEHMPPTDAPLTENAFSLDFVEAVNLKTQQGVALEHFVGVPVHAVAGIGHPQRFFQQLSRLGLDVYPHAFPDHYYFQADDLDFGDQLDVLMTEKDAVKCEAFAAENLWSVPVRAILSEAFRDNLLALVKRISSLKRADEN